MKTEGEFTHFYTEVLIPKLKNMDVLRKETYGRYVIFLVLVSLFLLGVARYAYVNMKPADMVNPVIFFTPIGLLLFIFTIVSIRSKYRKKFKEEIIGGMVKFLDDRLIYVSDKGLQPAVVIGSGLFFAVDEAGLSDYIEGKLGETYIQISKLSTSNSKFKGIFIVASFNKNFKERCLVLPRKYATTDSVFNKTVHEIESVIPPPVKLENPEFEKEFAAFGPDEIETRYLLTPAFMERMLDFKQKVNNDVYISFAHSHFFVAFGTEGYGIFEPSLDHQDNLDDIQQWYKDLQLAIGVVEEFDLNTRIWSKQ